MSRKTPHTATYRMHKVYVTLKSGEEFTDRFIERKGRFVYFQNRPRIHRSQIDKFVCFHAENFRSHYAPDTKTSPQADTS